MRLLPALVCANAIIFTAGLLTFTGSIGPDGGALIIIVTLLALPFSRLPRR